MKNSQKNQIPYFIGLDMGTNSVGFAVTDTEYNFIKKKGQKFFGFRLFEDAKTAVERRLARSSRRRIDRRNQRIKLVQEFFASEISKTDMGFYQRLQDSFFHEEDKQNKQRNTLFNDTNYKDKDFHNEFPTIYHLRKSLMENSDRKFDIRLIYLATAHILKKRGHFLFQDKDFDSKDNSSFKDIFYNFAVALRDFVTIDDDEFIDWTDNIDLQALLKEKITKKDKLNNLKEFFSLEKNNKQAEAVLKLLLGYKVKMYSIFLTEELEENPLEINFSDGNFDEKRDDFVNILGDDIELIDCAKGVYDYILLANILNGKDFISYAKVDSFEKHKEDLSKLKNLIKKHCNSSEYKELFKIDKKENYVAYTGNTKTESTCSQADFYAFLKKNYLEALKDDAIAKEILADIEDLAFLPKQNINSNGVIPYQLHLKELALILENASKHYPFLNDMDKEANLTVKEKILQIMTFRIPYYIGPLNNLHAQKDNPSNAWIVRKVKGQVLPWNFETMVDTDKTAEKFIRKMTNKCTYLVGEDVLPKNSILYSKYMVLNELNNLRINDEKISVELKQKIYNELFLTENSITQSKLKKYLKFIGACEKDCTISGIDKDFKASMKSYLQLRKILGAKFKLELAEEIIKTLALFGQESKLIKERLEKEYPSILSKEEIQRIANLRMQGWGAFSKKFLEGIQSNDTETGEVTSIIDRLWNTNENLMQLLSTSRYKYHEDIENINNALQKELSCTPKNFKSLVADLYCSPAIKRSIMQALRIVNEIKDVMGYEPAKIFMEMAREEGKKQRTVSRKNTLQDLYKKCQKDCRDDTYNELVSSLSTKTDADLRAKKLYLYYTQMGRCMYCGERIELNDLFNNNIYDIDHIYPRSQTKDDSLHNNLVLSLKDFNAKKGDIYPVSAEWREKQSAHWKRLEKSGLISKEKYKRLIRSTDLDENELAGFINRQLVETRQSTKATASLLKKLLPNTTLVFSKAGNVSEFRKRFDFVKVRELNDNHHAEDAYFNIIVGNVYYTKFTSSPLNYIKTETKKRSYNLARMYDFDVQRGENIAWRTESTINTIHKNLEKARPLFTRHATIETGAFYKQMPLKKMKGQIPLKSSDERLSIDKYGGYDKDSGSYFILVKHIDKKKEVRSIEYVPVRLASKIESGQLSLEDYCIKNLNIENPVILLDKIKFKTLFNINGFPMHLTGRQKKELLFSLAVQLEVSKELKYYMKKIENFYKRYSQSVKKDITVSKHDDITEEMNITLYQTFIEKLETTIYKNRPNSQIETLKKGLETFKVLSLEKQCLALIHILGLFKCRAGNTDLTLIQGSKGAGTKVMSNKLKASDRPRIIHQSVTGLYTHEIDLFSL